MDGYQRYLERKRYPVVFPSKTYAILDLSQSHVTVLVGSVTRSNDWRNDLDRLLRQ